LYASGSIRLEPVVAGIPSSPRIVGMLGHGDPHRGYGFFTFSARDTAGWRLPNFSPRPLTRHDDNLMLDTEKVFLQLDLFLQLPQPSSLFSATAATGGTSTLTGTHFHASL